MTCNPADDAPCWAVTEPTMLTLDATFQRLADALLLRDKPAATNEAWMELGALVCTPRQPRCPECPLRGVCRAAKSKTPEAFPNKKKKMVAIESCPDEVTYEEWRREYQKKIDSK